MLFLPQLQGTFSSFFQIGLKGAAIRLYGFADRLDIINSAGAFEDVGVNAVKLHNGSTTANYLKLLSGVNTTALTLTLPIVDATNKYDPLVSDAAGVLSFQNTLFRRTWDIAYTIPDNRQVTVSRFEVETGGILTVAGLLVVNKGDVDLTGTGEIVLSGDGVLEIISA